MRILHRGLVALCALGLGASAARAEDLTDLLRRLPGTTNTVAVFNVKAVRQLSGRGPDATGYEIIAGLLVPPAIDVVVYGFQVEPGAMDNRTTYVVGRLNRDVTIEDVASKSGGDTVKVGTGKVVLHSRKGYFALFGPRAVGAIRGASRQELVRWLEFARTAKAITLHEHLAAEVTALSDAPVCAVLDLEHMVEAKRVRARLATSKAMEGRSAADLDAAAALATGIKGLALTVGGKGLDQVELKFTFSEAVGDRAELVKAVFMEVLDDMGATIDEFEKASAAAEGSTVTLKVKMSSDGLARLLSPFLPPPAPPPTAAAAKLEPNGVSIAATRRYFEAVDQMLHDLKRKSTNSTNYKSTATWHDSFANRIEHLPTQYVDEGVVKYGESLVPRLRSLSYSLRGVIIETNALENGKSVQVAGTGMWGWFGGGSVQMDSNVQQIAAKQAEVMRKDGARRLQIWESINQDRNAVIKALRERYNLDYAPVDR